MKTNLKGLREQLRKFETNGYYVSGKNWTITHGGYDLYFEILYNGAPVLDCCANYIKPCRSDIENYKQIEQVVLQEYRDCKIYPMPTL